MNEININIEGYNVNGICVGCLNYNRQMFYDEDAKEVFRLIGNIDVPDGLSIQVCWECLAAVKSVLQFQNQIQSAFDVLITYSRQHTFLNSPEDFTRLSSTRLSISQVEHIVDITCGDVDIDNVDMKESLVKDESVFIDEDTQSSIKQEPTFDYSDHDNTYYSNTTQFDNDSDEDIQLSKLRDEKSKEKKEKKKGKKKKKKPKKDPEPEPEPSQKSRKLKNLPPSIVSLHTLTEQEMWVVRNNDVNSDEFKKLKYRCDDCIIGFNSAKLMEYHMNGKHKPKSESALKCDICKAYFLTKDNLSVHRSLHLSSYKCIQCNHMTTLKKNMGEHECVKGAMMMSEEYPCQDCDKVFGSKSKLSYHKNVVHAERPQCDCCGKVFANKMTLKYHLKILPQNKDEKPKEKLYINCKGCDKVFHTKKSYRAHVEQEQHKPLTPPEIIQAQNESDNSLPPNSKAKYLATYETFMQWKNSKNHQSFSENVLLAYFSELEKKYSPNTLWCIYSMLRSTIRAKYNINIKTYSKLLEFLKKSSNGYVGRTSKVLLPSDVEKFLNEAPDSQYLAIKVALIFGVAGGCKRQELCDITTEDVKTHGEIFLVKIPNTKNRLPRAFTIDGPFYEIVKKYKALRPANVKTNRFFLNYQKRKCTVQPIGVNKFGTMPREIAKYLNLPEPDTYTGQSFRKTSARLLADNSGAEISSLKRHGDWRSDAVAGSSKAKITSAILEPQRKQFCPESRQSFRDHDYSVIPDLINDNDPLSLLIPQNPTNSFIKVEIENEFIIP